MQRIDGTKMSNRNWRKIGIQEMSSSYYTCRNERKIFKQKKNKIWKRLQRKNIPTLSMLKGNMIQTLKQKKEMSIASQENKIEVFKDITISIKYSHLKWQRRIQKAK